MTTRYPIWDAVVGWKGCQREMIIPSFHKHQGNQRRIVINLDSLKSPLCEWNRGCPDLKDLRFFLARFFQTLYWKRIPRTETVQIPHPGQGKLSAEMIQKILDCVLPWTGDNFPNVRGCKVRDLGHLSLHNCIRITHPEIPGQVSSAFLVKYVTQ